MTFFNKDTSRKRKSYLFDNEEVYLDANRKKTGTSRKSFF